MAYDNTPQIQVTDQFAQVQTIQPAAVNVKYVDPKAVDDTPLFQFLTASFHEVCDRGAAFVGKAALSTLDGAAKVADVATSAGTAPFKDMAPSATPGLSDSNARSAPTPTLERSVGRDQFGGEIGNLSPSTASAGITQSQGRGVG